MEQKTGYRTITYRFRLYCGKRECLEETKKIYNQVLGFYYDVLQKEPELSGLPRQQAMRQLELLTIGGRGGGGTELKYPIPYPKVPLYFRRAAINDAVRLYKSYCSAREHGARPAGSFHASPIYYKGMYKDFCSTSISLKLFDGASWNWEVCGVDTCGREFPDEARLLSPTVKVNGKRTMLHVPVQEPVEDVRTVAERIQTEGRICAASFPANDCFAVLAVLTMDGGLQETKFIRGGSRLTHEKKKLLARLRKNRESMGGDVSKLPPEENRHIKERIHHLTEEAAHKASHQIVEFCRERGIRILVVPNYAKKLNGGGYPSAVSYDWLGRRIISYTKYKAFGKGMVVTGVSAKDISRTCHVCGAQVRKYNEGHTPSANYYGGKNFICPNGHKGNSHLNSAVNAGLRFLKTRAEMPR